ELLEEDARDLLSRAEHELLASELVRPALELGYPLREAGRDLAHPVGVDPHASAFHRREHLRERQLELAVEARELAVLEPLEQGRREPARKLGGADERGGLLVGGRDRDELDAVLGGELGERVRGTARLDQVRREDRVVGRLDSERL